MIFNTNKESEFVTELKYKIENDKVHITFKWPVNFEQVYIFKVKTTEPFNIETADFKKATIYTLDEYKSFRGYYEEIREVNQFCYTVYPFVRKKGEDTVFVQPNSNNSIVVEAGTIEIQYSILEKSKLFSPQKTIQIIIKPDRELSKDVLCYCLKKGGYPSGKTDGIMYTFVDDFIAGENVLPELTVGKKEYINIFLSNVEKHKNIYKLKLIN